jgi:DNA modification methylase
VFPIQKGRILYDSDFAYAFGEPPKSRKGNQVLRGEFATARSTDRKKIKHPCPRNFYHVLFLVNVFSNPGETVLDPFAGSLTTGVACETLGRPYILIEKNLDYIKDNINRIEEIREKGRLFPVDFGEYIEETETETEKEPGPDSVFYRSAPMFKQSLKFKKPGLLCFLPGTGN